MVARETVAFPSGIFEKTAVVESMDRWIGIGRLHRTPNGGLSFHVLRMDTGHPAEQSITHINVAMRSLDRWTQRPFRCEKGLEQ